MTSPIDIEALKAATPAGWALVPLKPSRKLIDDLANEWAYNTEEACESYCGFLDVVARHGFGGSDPEAYDEDAAAEARNAELVAQRDGLVEALTQAARNLDVCAVVIAKRYKDNRHTLAEGWAERARTAALSTIQGATA